MSNESTTSITVLFLHETTADHRLTSAQTGRHSTSPQHVTSMHYGKDGTLEKARNGASIAPKQRKGHSWTTAADERALLDPLCLCRLRFVPSPGPLDLDGLPPAWFTGPTGVKFCAMGGDTVAKLYRNPMLTRAGAVKISRTSDV